MSGLTVRRRSAEALTIYGAFAVALLLAASRWGSYIGINPLFLTDALLIVGALHFVVSMNIRPEKFDPKHFSSVVPTNIVLGLLLFWILLRLVASLDFSLIAIRDFVPYAYAGVGLLAGFSVSRANSSVIDRTQRLLTWALGFHALWYILVTVVYKPLPEILPLVSAAQNLHIFSPRNDFDASMTGLFGAMLLLNMLRREGRPFLTFIFFVFCWAAVMLNESRAALISAALVNLIAIIVFFVQSERTKANFRASLALIVSVPIGLAAVALFLPTTNLGMKVLAAFSPTAATSAFGAAGAGTARARENSWFHLFEWIFSDVHRTAGGVGFGTNFMVESGSSLLLIGNLLEGEDIPRSPHNYWLGSLARLGLVGLSLIVVLVILHLIIGWQLRRVLATDKFAFLLVMIPIALLVPTSLGVILESPFGAVPFWWSIGAAASYAAIRRSFREPIAPLAEMDTARG
jgi:hypothetical protein